MPRGAATRCLILYLALLLPTAAWPAMPRIATVDWTIAETLLALDAPPQGVAQVDAYNAWVAEPAMPDDVVDLGLRAQPNLELLAELAPDQILLSPMFENLKPRLRRIAPVDVLTLYTPETDTWHDMRVLTRELATLTGREARGERLIRETEERIATLSRRLDGHRQPLLIVQFTDARHVRVFGGNGLYQSVMERLELRNAWEGRTNHWGFSLVPLESLAGIEARIVVVKPYPEGVERELADNGLWPRLTGDNGPLELEPAWSFGALPSALRFAELLVQTLERDHE